MKSLEKIDAENEDFYKDSYQNVVTGERALNDIIGFDLKEPVVFIPRVPCSHVAPSVVSHCTPARERPTTSILTLLPLYNTLVYPIPSTYGKTKMSEVTFKEANDISLIDFLKTVEKGRIIPYFITKYRDYNVDFLRHFLEPGLPRISFMHMQLINRRNACKLTNGDCRKCGEGAKIARKDIAAFVKDTRKLEILRACAVCLQRAYEMGINKEKLLETTSPRHTLCAIIDILASRNIEAAFQTNCPIVKETLGLFAGAPEIEDPIETIVKGLKVKYTTDLNFESYLELLDGKTTKAVREVTKKILEDPFASKYSERLNSKIFEFNREVEEVAKSKTAKFYHAVSDIAVYGGSKFIERKTQGYLHLGRKRLHRVSEWIASKLMDFHAKATGKDWTVAQLYRTRWKIEQCRKHVSSENFQNLSIKSKKN